jgi:Protein of unknown function (DUF2568)
MGASEPDRGPPPLVAVNLAVRFGLELCALAAAAYWGSQAVSGPGRWLLAVAAPALVAAVWGMFVAPQAKVALPVAARRAIEACVFLAAAAGLAVSGQAVPGVILLVVAAVSGTLNHRFGWSPPPG